MNNAMIQTILDIPSFIFRTIAFVLSVVLVLVYFILWPFLNLFAKIMCMELDLSHRFMAYAFGWSYSKLQEEVNKIHAERAKKQ